jgi:hypothetical protein
MRISFLFHIHFVYIFFFLVRVNSIVDIINFANTSNISLANVSTSLLVDNGQTSYISMQNGSSYVINKYSINPSTGTLTYVNRFIDPYNRVYSNRLLIYNNTYMIAVSTNNLIFNVFGLSNYAFYGNYTIN